MCQSIKFNCPFMRIFIGRDYTKRCYLCPQLRNHEIIFGRIKKKRFSGQVFSADGLSAFSERKSFVQRLEGNLSIDPKSLQHTRATKNVNRLIRLFVNQWEQTCIPPRSQSHSLEQLTRLRVRTLANPLNINHESFNVCTDGIKLLLKVSINFNCRVGAYRTNNDREDDFRFWKSPYTTDSYRFFLRFPLRRVSVPAQRISHTCTTINNSLKFVR